jgi:pyruvate/2-oxoglutarate dehydrogenase complex dihydrolipoamide dehydrogenase (E3) component
VTYTAPEFAHVGLREDEARARDGRIRVLRWRYGDNDRAQAERETDGLIKVVVDRSGRILGAGIVGPHAGEVIQTWCLALKQGLAIGDIAGMIAPYPTIGYSNRKIAETFFAPALASRFVRGLVRLLIRLP